MELAGNSRTTYDAIHRERPSKSIVWKSQDTDPHFDPPLPPLNFVSIQVLRAGPLGEAHQLCTSVSASCNHTRQFYLAACGVDPVGRSREWKAAPETGNLPNITLPPLE